MKQIQALDILKTGVNVFLTGAPGAGKTYVINQYIDYLKQHNIEVAITASTGIAATHIGGVTIHSWSGIGIKEDLTKKDLDAISSTERIAKKIYRTKVLIIDEISMLHANTLTHIDLICREIKRKNEPFGGMQVVFVGDFFQLPPISKNIRPANALFRDTSMSATPVAYNAHLWNELALVVCYLSEAHRHEDKDMISILSAIRINQFGTVHLSHIKKRQILREDIPEHITKLYSKNVDVDKVNTEKLGALKGKSYFFEMKETGSATLCASLKKGCLSPEILELKEGALVMFTKNNLREGYVNGTLGTVDSFSSNLNPIIKTKKGRLIEVSRMEWAIEEQGKVKAKISQYPLRLAWALTIHKSQGASLDEAVMDLGDVFEFGQGYVALSRVRKLSGVFVLGWNDKAGKVSPEVMEKDKVFQQLSLEAEQVFRKMSSEDVKKMHSDFVRAVSSRG